MSYPLVLINGVISEEPFNQIGVYPRLKISTGILRAGGAGNSLYLINGSIVEVSGIVWDSGASTWDSGVSVWPE